MRTKSDVHFQYRRDPGFKHRHRVRPFQVRLMHKFGVRYLLISSCLVSGGYMGYRFGTGRGAGLVGQRLAYRAGELATK